MEETPKETTEETDEPKAAKAKVTKGRPPKKVAEKASATPKASSQGSLLPLSAKRGTESSPQTFESWVLYPSFLAGTDILNLLPN